MQQTLLRCIENQAQETISLLQQLIRIPSVNPPGNEGPVAELVSGELRHMGFEVQELEVEEGRPNIMARLPGNGAGPSLVCYAHMDVVPPGILSDWVVDPFSGDQIGDRIYGRGAIDHKSPIASLLGAVRAMKATGLALAGDLLFVFVADEENIGEKGMQYIAANRLLKADLGLYCTHTGVKDPVSRGITPWMGTDNILIAHNGKMLLRITVRGHSTHTMSLELGVNAITKALPVIEAVCALATRVNRRKHPLTGYARLSPNVIRGGEKDNILPDCCEIYIDRRYTPGEDRKRVFSEVEDVLASVKQKDPGLDAQVEIVRDDEPSGIVPDLPLVNTVRDAYREVTNREPIITGLAATADAKWFINHLGIPMLMVGCGDLYRAHRPNEFITVEELVETTKVYAFSILSLLK